MCWNMITYSPAQDKVFLLESAYSVDVSITRVSTLRGKHEVPNKIVIKTLKRIRKHYRSIIISNNLDISVHEFTKRYINLQLINGKSYYINWNINQACNLQDYVSLIKTGVDLDKAKKLYTNGASTEEVILYHEMPLEWAEKLLSK